MECAWTKQQSWIPLWLRFQAHIRAFIFVMAIGEIRKKSKMCQMHEFPYDLTWDKRTNVPLRASLMLKKYYIKSNH